MTTLDPREDVQSRIDGKLVARMIVEFHRELRDTYGTSVMVSDLCAVGPLQSMIGLAIKNGHLAPSQPAAVGEDRVAWLIERKGFAGDPRPHWYWEDTLGHHAWTPEANAALPFKTKAEAEAFPAYRMISRDPEISITEHVFMAALEAALRSTP